MIAASVYVNRKWTANFDSVRWLSKDTNDVGVTMLVDLVGKETVSYEQP